MEAFKDALNLNEEVESSKIQIHREKRQLMDIPLNSLNDLELSRALPREKEKQGNCYIAKSYTLK